MTDRHCFPGMCGVQCRSQDIHPVSHAPCPYLPHSGGCSTITVCLLVALDAVSSLKAGIGPFISVILQHTQHRSGTWQILKTITGTGACMCAKSLQSCPTLCSLTDSRLLCPRDSLRRLESVALPFSKASSQPRDGNCVSFLLPCRWVVYH